MIRTALRSDAAAIARIYNHYVRTSVVTFEEQAVAPAEIAARIAEVESASLPWRVVVEDGEVAGYAYAGKWKGRCAYRFSVESTVYVDPLRLGRGLGTRLYADLLAILRQRRLHSAIGGIALPNAASVALHQKLGFRKVAHFPEVGFKFDRWIDVGYWQVLLDAAGDGSAAR